MGGHGSDTNELLKDNLYNDYPMIEDRVLFFSLVQKNDYALTYPPACNYNNLEERNKNKIINCNESNAACYKLKHSTFKIVDNLRTELIENNNLVSNVSQ